MAMNCDPCECVDQYYRDTHAWYKAVLILLCRIAEGGGEAADVNVLSIAAGTNLIGQVVSGDETAYIYDGTTPLTPKWAFANVAASQTDSSIVAAVANKKIRVLAAIMVAGATATNITFNSKGGGAGTAISALLANGANGGAVLGYNPLGWMETTAGEALTVTTGAGSATGVHVQYIEV